MEGYTLACKVKQEKLGASLVRLIPAEIWRKTLEVSMNSVLQHILDDSDSEKRASVFNILLVSRDMHAAATKTALFPIFIADMLGTADYQRILREFAWMHGSTRRSGYPNNPMVSSRRRRCLRQDELADPRRRQDRRPHRPGPGSIWIAPTRPVHQSP